MKGRHILFAICFASVLVSCKKILDTEPTHQLDGSSSFNEIEDYDFALTGAYSLLRSPNYYGSLAGSNAYVGLPDMLTDNLNETPESLSNYTNMTTWAYAEDETYIDSTWLAAYRVISQCNLVLRDIDRFAPTEAGAVNRIKGQALALRAMVHFDVLRYWSDDFDRNSEKPGIPYISEFNYEAEPARESVKLNYDHIEADLLQAKDLMTDMDRDINEGGRAYIDSDVVNAILARIHLYSKQWDRAIEYSTLVIDAIPLATPEAFPDIWTDASEDEVIWSISFNSGEGGIGDNIYFASINNSAFAPNPALAATYDENADVRYHAYFRTITHNNGTVDRLVFAKYFAKASQLTNPDGVVNFKAFRTGEMYLIRAEAHARKGEEAAALEDLNALRSARIEGFTPGNESGAGLLSAIALERRKELVGEGHRWFDLKRTTRTIERTHCNNSCSLAPDDRAWAWPIPISELNANPNMEQNEGY